MSPTRNRKAETHAPIHQDNPRRNVVSHAQLAVLPLGGYVPPKHFTLARPVVSPQGVLAPVVLGAPHSLGSVHRRASWQHLGQPAHNIQAHVRAGIEVWKAGT